MRRPRTTSRMPRSSGPAGDDRGVTVVEYGLIVALIGIVAIVGMFLVRDQITTAFTSTITTPGAKACPAPCTAYDVLPAVNMPSLAPVTLLYENIAATVNVPFTSPAPTVAGGSGASTFSISAGSLPSGWVLSSSTGVISGMSSSDLNTSVEVTVVNSGGSATAVVAISVGAPVLRLSPYPAYSGRVGVAYTSATPSVTGSTGSNVFSVSGGSLPAGLALNPTTGVISGTPTAAYATAIVTIRVTDSLNFDEQAISMTVEAGCAANQILIGTTCTDVPAITFCFEGKKNRASDINAFFVPPFTPAGSYPAVLTTVSDTATPDLAVQKSDTVITFKAGSANTGSDTITFGFTVTNSANGTSGSGTGTINVTWTTSGSETASPC